MCFIVPWLIVPTLFGVSVIYNVFYRVMVDRTNHIWSASNLQRVFIVSWLIVPTIFGVPVIYNVYLLCHG